MTRAQTAFAVLTGLFLMAAAAMFGTDDPIPGYVMLALASVGFLGLGGMILYDARAEQKPADS